MNDFNSINLRKILKLLVMVAAIFLGLFIVFKLALYVIPFIIALIVSTLIEPLIKLMMAKLRLSRKLAALITLLFVLITFGLIIVIIITRLISEISSMSHILPQYFSDLYTNIDRFIRRGTDIYLGLPKEVTGNIESMISNLSNSLMDVLNKFFKGILNTAVSVPQALIFTLVTILSTYLLASDRDRIYDFFKSQMPDSWVNKIRSIKDDMFSALFGYIKAQLILMSITFSELYTGFLIIHLKHPLILAMVISIVDALPILGTGGILIPWSIYEFLTGDVRQGVSILVIYGIVLIVRQLTEPKILGQQIGVHPLLTLVAMYTGLQLFGVFGLILGPITVLLLKNIFSGVFKNKSIKDVLSRNK